MAKAQLSNYRKYFPVIKNFFIQTTKYLYANHATVDATQKLNTIATVRIQGRIKDLTIRLNWIPRQTL